VVLYELLTGTKPFTGETRLLVQQILMEEPRSLRKLDRTVPRPLETICLKAMSKDPNRRYTSAADFAADLRRFLRDEPIKARPVSHAERVWRWARRNPVIASASAAAAMLACLLGVVLWQRHLETQAAFRDVALDTIPSGAKVVFVPIDDATRVPRPNDLVRPRQLSPLVVRLKPGPYLVVADLEDSGFHEVYRFVPFNPESSPGPYTHNRWTARSDGAIELPAITIAATENVIANMTFFEGGAFEMGSEQLNYAPRHSRQVEDFYLDQTEVTIADYQRLKDLPVELENHPTDLPITLVTFDQALEFAELAGKRLMTEAEYEYAATQRGTRVYPWGDDETQVIPAIFQSQPVGQPAFDQTATAPPVYGLYSNVTEWTDSLLNSYLPREKPLPESLLRQISISRVLRGGPTTEDGVADAPAVPPRLLVGPRQRSAINHAQKLSFLGFRCARSIRPHFMQ
ncbi:MAG: SUMF1/EgtB/PvdO family nonheme iron enzyme, partial [Planctomycetaceae bacterium]|nr:SUMF1/EgtB/PvdO family nonheme iron enzyme [Planctomycetaceae bacterium]